MTALPEWTYSSPDGLTAEEYDVLPEDFCRRIEVVDGAIVLSPSPRRTHQRVVQRLANLLDSACGPSLAAVIDSDLRLRDVPLLNRRPDIVVYDSSVPDDQVLRPGHCLLVVEVMSPGSITTDRVDKPAEYSAADIPHFWRVEIDEAGRVAVHRFRFDATTRTYAAIGVDMDKLVVTDPVQLSIGFSELL